MRFQPATLGLLLCSITAWACAPVLSPSTSSSSALDPTLRQSTYIEEGNLVALIVSTRPTRFRLSRDYIPLEIAVVNKGLEKLSLTPESFTLVAGGKEYAVAGSEELRKNYGSVDVDRNFLEAGPAVASRFSSYTLVPSNMTPGFDQPIARDRVFLPRFSYIHDVIYFPRPPGEIVSQPLELFLRAPELPNPVFVRFEVRGKKR